MRLFVAERDVQRAVYEPRAGCRWRYGWRCATVLAEEGARSWSPRDFLSINITAGRTAARVRGRHDGDEAATAKLAWWGAGVLFWWIWGGKTPNALIASSADTDNRG